MPKAILLENARASILNPTLSYFKFLVLPTVSHNKQCLQSALQAQKVFILGHGFYLLRLTSSLLFYGCQLIINIQF